MPVQDVVEAGLHVAGPRVLDPLFRMEEVAADLRAEADLGHLTVLGGLFGLAFFLLDPSQAGPKHLQGGRAVLVLAPLALAGHDDPGGQVDQADRAGGLVDVLPARSAGAEDLLLEILVADLDVDRVAHFGCHVDGREARLALSLGVERADADQAVDATLALEVSVGHRAANGNHRAVDSRLFVVLAVEQFGLVLVVLGPIEIHPQEHLGPVVGVGPAVSSVDRQQG